MARCRPNAARAGDLLGKACDHGDEDGCFSLGKSLLASDAPKAVQIFTAECKHDERGCDALGDLYRVGVAGIAPDAKLAHEAYTQRARPASMSPATRRSAWTATPTVASMRGKRSATATTGSAVLLTSSSSSEDGSTVERKRLPSWSPARFICRSRKLSPWMTRT